MSNTSIQLKKSGQTGNIPPSLAHGEVALNYADGKLYYKTDSNVISYITNQYSFETINVGGNLILATSTTDTLNFVAGDYINLTTDSLNNKITIATTGQTNANIANTANVAINARITLVDTGVYYPIITDTKITGSDTLHYSNNDFIMYAANNTFKASGNIWAGQYITVGSNYPVVNSTGYWIGQPLLANTSERSNVSVYTSVSKLDEGIFYPVLVSTTSDDNLNFANSDFTFNAAEASFQAAGNISVGQNLFVTGQQLTTYEFEGSPLGHSYQFNGTNTYLSIGSSSDILIPYANNFTIESFVYLTNPNATQAIISKGTSLNDWFFGISSTAHLYFQGPSTIYVTSANTILANTWTHVSVSRTGGSLYLHINGVLEDSAVNSINFNSADETRIGRGRGTGTSYLKGYISNLRFINNEGLYSGSNFNPVDTTNPLTATANTVLLTAQSPTIRDNSNNSFTLKNYYGVKVNSNYTPYTPYAVSVSLNPTGNVTLQPNQSIIFSDGTKQNTSSQSASNYANSAFIKANAAFAYANSGIAIANTANTANTANIANTANVAINARITNVTTGTYYPIITDTTVTGSDTLHYSSNDFQMYAANNTFRATGNVWAGTYVTVGTNIPVINAAGYWVGQPIAGSGGGTTDQYARDTANSAGLYANSAFNQANTATTDAATADAKAVTAGSYANSAFNQANTDVTNINITSDTYGNSSYIPIITVSANGRINSISTIASAGGSGSDQYARDTSNAAFIQANAAFAQANTGGGGAITGSAIIALDTFTANGSQIDFALSYPTTSNSVIVNIDGVLQLKSAYSVSGNTITFTGTPANNAVVEVTTLTGTNLSYYNRTYTGDNTTTSFASTSGVSTASIIVTENGIVQEPGVDYYISGANVIFTTAPSTGVKVGIRELASTAVVDVNLDVNQSIDAAFTQANSAYNKANTASVTTGKAIAMAIVFGG